MLIAFNLAFQERGSPLKKNELTLLWPFYVTTFTASSLSVTLPVWVVFFQRQFSFVEISCALTLQSVASILFEIPTGAIADVFGRKVSVVLGIALQGLLWLALPFIHLNIVLYAAFFTMGIFRTLESGADSAWVIDWLKENKRGNLIQDMFIKMQSLSSVGFLVSSLLTTVLLCLLDIRFLFFVQGSGYIIESCVLLFFAKETVRRRKRKKVDKIFRNAVTTTKNGIEFILKSKPLLYLVMATMFAAGSRNLGCVAWQPLLVGLSMPAGNLGAVLSIASLMGIVAPFFSKRLLARFELETHYLSFTTLIEFVCLAFLYLVNKPFFMLGVIVYSAAMLINDVQAPVSSFYFQSLIPSNIRATVGSVQSMIFALFSFFTTIIGGYAMDKKGPKMAIIYFSFFLIPASIFYLKIKGRAVLPVSAHLATSGAGGRPESQPQACMVEGWIFHTKLLIASKLTAFTSLLPVSFLPQPHPSHRWWSSWRRSVTIISGRKIWLYHKAEKKRARLVILPLQGRIVAC